MDYTTVPRSLIYRERRSLEEFGAYEKESITRPLAEAMLHMDFIQYTDSENRALWCLNTAYYICTMILLETDPRWRISKYKGLAIPKWNFGNGDFQVLTLALAGLLLSRLEEPLPLLSSKGQTRNHFVALMLDDGEFNPVFKQLYERVKADPYIKGTIPNSTFAPRVIDKECINDVMSDSVFNWVSFTKYWESRSMLDIVKCLGTNEDEKHNLIDMLRQSSHGFYSAGCNDYPEQVDAILDSFDQEIHMQYNPETDQTMEENNSEQNNYLELKPFEKALIDSLKDENARLREEINQIKEYIKGAITIDDVNEALIVGEFGLSPEKAKKMVADAIARAENEGSVSQQSEPRNVERASSNIDLDGAENEKDRQIIELRGENNRLNSEVNRLTQENDELRKKSAEEDDTKWISCFDGFLHSHLNPMSIAKALDGITHSNFSKKERGFWWVFVTVLTEINWIPERNYKLALQWANLHFDCGWDWKKDNLFKFSDINKKIKSVQPSSKWNKKVTGNVIGDYYGELAKTMKETFVDVVEGNKLLDKKEFIRPGCPLINNGH